MRLTPVQTAKIAVERPSPPLRAGAGRCRPGARWPRRSRLAPVPADRYHTPPTDRRRTARVANIKQQKKRNRRSLEQRERNLRYRSTIKTLFRRLDDAVESGDGGRVEERGPRQLEHLIDRAAAEGVIHRNNAARKKSRVARVSPGVPEPAPPPSFLRPAPASRRAPGRAGPAPPPPARAARRRPACGPARAGR